MKLRHVAAVLSGCYPLLRNLAIGMRESNRRPRSTNEIPRLEPKYIGQGNNRDFYANTLSLILLFGFDIVANNDGLVMRFVLRGKQ
jgi:hypothetical protein